MQSGSREFSKAAGEALSQSHLSCDTKSPREWPPPGWEQPQAAGPGMGTAGQVPWVRSSEREARSHGPHIWRGSCTRHDHVGPSGTTRDSSWQRNEHGDKREPSAGWEREVGTGQQLDASAPIRSSL